ncbi:polysaccharide biosynthesis protein [Candidatus Enterovibrio altilux]|uniref:UDP-N-acetylglucosamine 4,6-dehydratase n=1 Tax=Candidatus Enterovibrio altilux TaxID=1927128 RepID=A0A291B7Z1_9GAMM|nr:nucleoside-diphosphate sugar epimerase/dehydratase [Candidatus Enterovibrio luxaltus]ATF09087.1 UDP-N-acetylglucosamine 4,6-dehydratase [Candidatus Enterovibrio luxaltus]
MFTPIQLLLNAQRKNKRIISVIYDIVAVTLSLYFAMTLRLDTLTFPIDAAAIFCMLITCAITIFSFIKLGMYRAILRYMMLPAVGNIFIAVVVSAITLAISSFFLQAFIPRSVPFIYASLAMITLGTPRIMIRTVYYHHYRRKKPNVLIYGAGSTGRDLAYSLMQGGEYHPVAFLDDNPAKTGQIITGIKIYTSAEFEKLHSLYEPVKLLLAINNISKGERLRLINELSHWPIEVQSVPSVEDIVSGKARVTDIKDLDIADLLGREPVSPNTELLQKNITDKSVLVTGAGGSIGSELCRQIFTQNPKTLVLFELNEYNLYAIHQELETFKNNFGLETHLVAALGSVQKENRLTKLMTEYKIESVYHSAAYKHVPLVEDNIIEGIQNNVFGTLACANAAIATGVKNFTLISTDKAVRPTNIMGASKRMAELVLQALADRSTKTNFTMVRFGNVLGSSGSVVPLFKKQVRQGGPVTVTHPDITRYFMLIPEAAQLVIQASAMGHNGQVFVLDMGEPVKIVDLAKHMINLMGMKSYISETGDTDGDIEIRFLGLRPGEKLYEELLIGDNIESTSHHKIMTAKEVKLGWDEMKDLLKKLDVCCHNFNTDCIRRILLEAPTGYKPNQKIDTVPMRIRH